MKKILFTLLVLVQVPLYAQYDTLAAEGKFWAAVSQNDFKSAGELGASVAEYVPDYLYLAAVSNHLAYEYEMYYRMREVYFQFRGKELFELELLLQKKYDETNPYVNNLYGVIQYNLKDLNLRSPEHYFNQTLKLDPSNSVANNYLSLIEVNNRNYDKAIKLSQESIKSDSTYPEPYNNLAYCLDQKGQQKEALELLVTCMRKCPKNTVSTYMNFIGLACESQVVQYGDVMYEAPGFKNAEFLKSTLEKLKNNQTSLLGLVEQLMNYNSYGEAIRILDQFDPEPEAWYQYYYLKGVTGVMIENGSMVETVCDSLMNRGEFDYAFELGNIALQSESPQMAVWIYEKVAKMDQEKDPENQMKLHSNTGAAYLHLAQFDKAKISFEKALQVDPEDDITLTNLGITYVQMGKKGKAKKILTKAKEVVKSEGQMEAINTALESLNK